MSRRGIFAILCFAVAYWLNPAQYDRHLKHEVCRSDASFRMLTDPMVDSLSGGFFCRRKPLFNQCLLTRWGLADRREIDSEPQGLGPPKDEALVTKRYLGVWCRQSIPMLVARQRLETRGSLQQLQENKDRNYSSDRSSGPAFSPGLGASRLRIYRLLFLRTPARCGELHLQHVTLSGHHLIEHGIHKKAEK